MNVCIAAGGTGGHLYPGIALAQEMMRQDEKSQIQFVGTPRGLEVRVLPEVGFELRCIAARGVMGTSPIRALVALAQLPYAIGQCIRLLRKKKSDLVIGIGGYTSPPLFFAALYLGIPRVLVEPNVIPGMANRVLCRIADTVLLAFEETKRSFRGVPTYVVGVPLRRGFKRFQDTKTVDRWHGDRHTILIFGGSQGSRTLNRVVVRAVSFLNTNRAGLRIVHQTGGSDCLFVRHDYAERHLDATVVTSLDDMAAAYAAADVVISRAGAGTIAELTACGKPAILIPFPSAAGQHQLRNAEVMVNAGAAVLIEETCLSDRLLADTIQTLISDTDRLARMARCSAELAKHDATEQSVKFCRELVEQPSRRAV
ncbi:MAG: undecaprenyldiphospho-muramoylpentapeptide beta-N-acetylglucosaminyltransferase [Nitrospiraceae bacterium]|nr:undecaprenyldiphospho-muramoylpentapeptide beta-N-acetylglucosaminyltransferase [Nitrospiraceae bacterium]|tara:strand:+ start:2153 stop:3259 length:1107 start_codon:yes stop_codon:yes gene_type:complete